MGECMIRLHHSNLLDWVDIIGLSAQSLSARCWGGRFLGVYRFTSLTTADWQYLLSLHDQQPSDLNYSQHGGSPESWAGKQELHIPHAELAVGEKVG